MSSVDVARRRGIRGVKSARVACKSAKDAVDYIDVKNGKQYRVLRMVPYGVKKPILKVRILAFLFLSYI